MPPRPRYVIALMFPAFVLAVAPSCSTVTAPEAGAPAAILFIGNSLTYTNDLPGMVAAIAGADGDSVRVDAVAGPDLAVIDHTNGATDAVARIDGGRWTFVVLQQGPTPEGTCRDTLVIAAMRLDPHVRAAGGRPVVVAPWARQGYPHSVDFAQRSAEVAARAVGGVVAPVGRAWQVALAADPALTLYGPDGYHPAPAGTLLAALTLYDRVLDRDVRAIAPDAITRLSRVALSSEVARRLAVAAHEAARGIPADPTTAEPVDTTNVSRTGGPC